MFNKHFDIVIIGSGISGLYCAYKILKINPLCKLLVLEKNNKDHIGGRAGNYNFYGIPVVIGAGIGRKRKDKLLEQLLIDLNMPIVTSITNHNYSPLIIPKISVKDIYLKIKNKFLENLPPHQTFKKYVRTILDEKLYKDFVISAGLSDYENEDIYDTIFEYGFDDNYENFEMFSVPWSKLVENLVSKIGSSNIKTNTEVISINKEKFQYLINTNNIKYKKILTNKIIIATNIECLKKLLPNKIYDNIKGQPFIRVYGKFSKSNTEILKKYVKTTTIVKGPLQKITPMNFDKGVFMLAYSDNKNALYLNKISKNTKNNREKFCELIEVALGIPLDTLKLISIKSFFWNIGTHYYDILNTDKYKDRKDYLKYAQIPEKNILVVGELISMNQGWTQGALESVEAVLFEKWIKNIK